MSDATTSAKFYGDFSALSALKREARAENPQALRQAAQQFESLFTEMMLKSMRAASFGDELTGSNEVEFYQGMFDQQLSAQLSKGKGMGLADMLVQQLVRSGLEAPSTAAAASGYAVGRTSVRLDQDVGLRPDLQAATPAEFVSCIWPHAQKAAQALGVDPATLVAHAALETGWGKHVPSNADGSSSFNLFGIKASSDWRGNSAAASTLEYEQDMPVQQVAQFKSYTSLTDCFADYAQLLGSKARYQGAVNSGSNASQFAQSLQRGGYATDPGYSDKLQSVARSVNSLLGKAGG